MKTKAQVIREHEAHKALINAVINQLGGFDVAKEDMENVCRCSVGAAGGFGGFIYYSDTMRFYGRHRKAILSLVGEYADEVGKSATDFVASFRCLEGEDADTIGRTLYGTAGDRDTIVSNALAWFALEEVSRWFCDE